MSIVWNGDCRVGVHVLGGGQSIDRQQETLKETSGERVVVN